VFEGVFKVKRHLSKENTRVVFVQGKITETYLLTRERAIDSTQCVFFGCAPFFVGSM
jgi:hypothetical protein